MQKLIIQKEILELEAKLLSISKSVFDVSNVDTINEWIVKVLKANNKLSKNFHLPTQQEIKDALSTLIQNNSLITVPIANLLARRISEFISTIDDVYNHRLRGQALDGLLTAFVPLVQLVNKHNDNITQPKSIKLVAKALENNRLHVYKSNPREPDLRVVLRAFYEDKDRSQRRVIDEILNFVLSQLKMNKTTNGFISQPRHMWWAVQTLFSEADDRWLQRNKRELQRILDHLINKVVEYSPRTDISFYSVVPELDSIYNERTWVTINAIRLFKHNIEKYVSSDTVDS